MGAEVRPAPGSTLEPGLPQARAVLAALPMPAALVGLDGCVRAHNAAWSASAEKLGSRGTALGATLLLPGAGPQLLAAVLNGTVTGQRLEVPSPSFGGPYVAVEVRGLPAPEGRMALVLLSDVSAPHRAAEAQAESEQRFRQLAESINEVFWLTTPEKDVMLYVSPAYERIWGRSCAELYASPRRWLDAIHPEDRKRVIASLADQGHGAYDIEYRILDAAGRVRWIRDRAFPVLDAAGQVYRIAGVADDVTLVHEALGAARAGEERLQRLHAEMEAHVAQRTEELREANDSLRLAERRLRQVIDLVPHFVFAKDAQGRFLLVNQAVADAYGTTVEALHGKTDADFASSPEEARRFREDDLQVIRGGAPKLVPEEAITDAAGQTRLLATVKIPFTYSGTSTPAVLGVSIDITERKRLEQQLLHAQKMEGLGRLAGGIAHDFNNLLTVIVGCLQMLESPALAPDQRLNVERIRDAADRAAGLTHQLLTFARGQTATPRPMDLGALVLEMERLLRRVLGDDVTLQAEVPQGLWPVEADQAQMEQVLLNLVVNARDAMPRGGRLTVKVQNVPAAQSREQGGPLAPPGDTVELSVTDTGVGMDAATQSRMFEPFFTTKGAGQGTGLGLSTCYGIVHRFGGHIWAESTLGAGSTFRLLMPRCAQPARGSAPSRAGALAAAGGGETVLVVEDHAAVRDVTVQALTRHGYRVLSAATPAEALTRALGTPGPIHLVVTDVVMPEMSGPELVKRLVSARPSLRVLYVSGYSHDALRLDPGGAGAELLPKPFTPGILARRVRDLLDRPSPGDPAKAQAPPP